MLQETPTPREIRPSGAELLLELRPSRQRIRIALRVMLGAVVCYLAALFLRVQDPGLAVLFTVVALGPAHHPNFRNMWTNLILLCGLTGGVLALSGPLSEAPWLALPVAATATAILFALAKVYPKYSLGFVCGAIATLTTLTISMLVPQSVSESAGQQALALGLGLFVGTAATQLLWPVDAQQALARQLADVYRDRQRQFDTLVEATFHSERPDTIHSLHSSAGLAANLASLSTVQPTSPRDALDRGRRIALITTGRHVSALVKQYSQVIRLRSTGAVARHMSGEYRRMSEAMSGAIGAYAECAEARFGEGYSSRQRKDWPDLLSLVDDLRKTWHRMLADPAFAPNGTPFPAVLHLLDQLADELRLPPEDFVRHAESSSRPAVPRKAVWWPTAANWTSALATVLAMGFVLFARNPEMLTAPWTATTLQETSYGGAIRKTILRISGAVVGGLLSIAAIIVIAPNTNDVMWPTLLVGAIAFIAGYGSQSNAKYAYGFQQMGNTFFLCGIAALPAVSLDVTFSRWLGIGTGIACLFVCFSLFAKNTAGNQILRHLAGILTPLPSLLSSNKQVPAEVIARAEEDRLNHIQSALGLFDAAVFEGAGSGIDVSAAPAALSWARRATLHSMALASKGLPPDTSSRVRAAMGRAERSAAKWMGAAADLVETTESLGQPRARATRAARRQITAIATQRLPDLQGPLEDLRRTLNEARRSGTDDADAIDAANARLTHIARLADLLPRLHHALVKTCLPGSTLAETDLALLSP